jgi:hypothetical protein
VQAVLHTKQHNIKHIMVGKKACPPYTKPPAANTNGGFLWPCSCTNLTTAFLKFP